MLPIISVIMPNYNTPLEYLEKAVNSILTQTFYDFEFIIIDDCSTDNSYSFLRSLDDKRIKLVRNKKNLGVTASLNVGLEIAVGEYIARMDSDDISLPERFERQLEYMNAHRDVIVCGTFAEEIGDRNGKRCRKIPNVEEYQCGVLFGNVYGLIHPTAFFRASELRKNHIRYDENVKTAQDYAMWASCVRFGKISNVEEVLFQYRIHGKQISSEKKDIQKRCTMYTMKQQLLHIIPDITDEEVQLHYEYCISNNVSLEMKKWFRRIIKANTECKYVNEDELAKFIDMFIQEKINAASMTANSPGKLIRLFFASGLKEKRVILNNILKRISRRIPLMRLECGNTIFSKLKDIVYNFKSKNGNGGGRFQ